MVHPPIRRAGRNDLVALDAGLRALSAELGDVHRAGIAELAAAGLTDPPAFVALLARTGDDPAGLALASPVFSTTRGGAGVHVSDLWVAPPWRGRGLGAALLARARDLGGALWQTRFLRLEVAPENARARAFYDRLGFTASDATTMTLTGAPLAALKECP